MTAGQFANRILQLKEAIGLLKTQVQATPTMGTASADAGEWIIVREKQASTDPAID